MQLVEPVLVEIVEELARTDRLFGHLQVVDPLVPVAVSSIAVAITAPYGSVTMHVQ